MSAPQPPTLPPTPESTTSYARLKHNMSLGLLVACPLIIALPPRKLDFYTFGLGTFWVFSLNQITTERTGRSILQNLDMRKPSLVRDLPGEKARDVQERLKRERLLRAQPGGQGSERGEEGNAKEKGVVEKLWMGQEGEGWKERRIREEREALEEGRGYGGLIVDQIWEVWNWGKTKEKGDDMGEGREGPPVAAAGAAAVESGGRRDEGRK